MPEILRNLAIARFLLRLGMLIWLDEFRLDLINKLCNNTYEQPLTIKG